jgi:hypothetical protein
VEKATFSTWERFALTAPLEARKSRSSRQLGRSKEGKTITMTITRYSLSSAPEPELSMGVAGTAAWDSAAPANAGWDACTCQRQEAPEPAGNVVQLYPVVREAKERRQWLTASEAGMATAEYAIATLAAVGFAGLLVFILRSDEVRGFLLNLIRTALALP